MNELRTIETSCPYCGEAIELVVDCSVANQRYIEDCEVCCRPINVSVTLANDGTPTVQTQPEDD